jgi:hypothetical protein
LRRLDGGHEKAGMPSRFGRNGSVQWLRLTSESRRHFAPARAQANRAARMNGILNDQLSPPPGRVKIAAVLAAGAIALIALDAGLELRPAPTPAQPAVARAFPLQEKAQEKANQTSGLRNFAYYPEQLAALTSLSSFTPVSDPGLADSAPPASAAHPAAPASEARPVRRAEAPAKAAPPFAVQAPVPMAAAVGAEPAPDRSVRLFGVVVPGAAEIGDRVASLKENASRWGESAWGLGGKLAGGAWR